MVPYTSLSGGSNMQFLKRRLAPGRSLFVLAARFRARSEVTYDAHLEETSAQWLAADGSSCGLSSMGLASTFIKADIPMLKRMSESVVRAQVSDVRSERIGRGMIFTYVTLDVTSTLHGEAGGQLVVKVPGGTVDGYTIKMEGAPGISKGVYGGGVHRPVG